jgi:hypothetical protein
MTCQQACRSSSCCVQFPQHEFPLITRPPVGGSMLDPGTVPPAPALPPRSGTQLGNGSSTLPPCFLYSILQHAVRLLSIYLLRTIRPLATLGFKVHWTTASLHTAPRSFELTWQRHPYPGRTFRYVFFNFLFARSPATRGATMALSHPSGILYFRSTRSSAALKSPPPRRRISTASCSCCR